MAAQQGRALYFSAVVSSFFLLLCFFFHLFSAVGDWMSTILSHVVSLRANLECMCCTRSLKIQDAKLRKKLPSAHHRTNLSGYIFATKACIDNRKEVH